MVVCQASFASRASPRHADRHASYFGLHRGTGRADHPRYGEFQIEFGPARYEYGSDGASNTAKEPAVVSRVFEEFCLALRLELDEYKGLNGDYIGMQFH